MSIKLRNEKKLDLDLIQIQFWDIFNGKIKKNTDYICDCNWGRNIICGLMLKVDIDKITTEKLRSQISDRETIFHVLLRNLEQGMETKPKHLIWIHVL